MTDRPERASARQLVARYTQLKNDRSAWETMWQELIDYFVPNKAPVVPKKQQGKKQTDKLFDSTALDCINRLTAAMHGNLTPPPMQWFHLKMRKDELNEHDEVTSWLEECAKRMLRAYNQSNFNSEVNELYADLIVFGTGFMIEEEKPKVAGKFGGLRFKAFSIGTYCIEEDYEGYVDTVFREFKLSARQAKQKFGDDALKSDKIADCLRPNGKPDTRFTFLHAIYPREIYDTSEKARANRMKYASVYICLDDRKLISEGGFPEFPGMAPRWSKASDEIYGRGPGLLALPDVKVINRAKELGLKAWAKEIDPPLLVKNAGVVGQVKTTPGGQTVITDDGDVKTLDLRIRHDVTRYNIELLVSAIRGMLYADQLILKNSPQMTAEEVRARMDLMQRILGPTLGRLESELLNRMIERTFEIMAREGALPEPPAMVVEAYRENEANIDIEYEGPLARMQRLGEIEAIDRMYAGILPIYEAGIREVMDPINHSKCTRLRAKILGVPSDVMNSEKEEKDNVDARLTAQAELADREKAAQSAKTAKDAASASVTAAQVPDSMNEEAAAGAGGML